MSLHKITDIIEADYGCEERIDGPYAVLIFEDGGKLEVSEKWISEQGIKEGKFIWIREDSSFLKAVRVVGAIIVAEEAIVREIKEELDTDIKVEKYIDTIEYDYPNFHLSMDCFLCSITSGNLVLKEHEAAKWLKKEELDSVEWLPADITIVDKVRELL